MNPAPTAAAPIEPFLLRLVHLPTVTDTTHVKPPTLTPPTDCSHRSIRRTVTLQSLFNCAAPHAAAPLRYFEDEDEEDEEADEEADEVDANCSMAVSSDAGAASLFASAP